MVYSQGLIALFNHCFLGSHNTLLVGGADEPEYLPEAGGSPARIVFTRDYSASALHEIAHWCVAGDARRRLPDYGYWYIPDGRNQQQQQQFEQVEVKPQALEWIFSTACGLSFRISADNVEAALGPSQTFRHDIVSQVYDYCDYGLNPRARQWVQALSQHFCTHGVLDKERYSLEALD
ncbi:MAG: elongation factor P hydroxylase [Pseudomonadota bacterium]